MTVKLSDIAQRAGVSVATVSRALYGTHPVARETQERIRQAMVDLKYAPRKKGQRFLDQTEYQPRRTGNIGVILGEIRKKFSDPFWSSVLEGISDELLHHHYHLRFAFTYDDLAQEQQFRLISPTHIDGLIFVGHYFGAYEPIIEAIDSAYIVSIEQEWEAPLQTDNVVVEKRRSMKALMNHLVSLGHQRFSFLSGRRPDERTEAFIEEMRLHQLLLPDDFYVEVSWVIEEATPQIQTWLQQLTTLPDVLVCASDAIAIAARRAAERCGIRVPAELAITGFDDIPFARDLDPPLTTIHVPKELLGRTAVRRLIDRIQSPDLPPLVLMVPTNLIVRRSCGAQGDNQTLK